MASSYICAELARTYSASASQKRLYRNFQTRWDDGLGTAALTEAAILLEYGATYQSSHPELPNALATDIEHTQEEDHPQFWMTRFTYELNRRDAEDKQQSIANPVNRTPRVSCSWETLRVPVPDDRDGNLIKNSAGQVPDPRVEVDGDMQAVHVEADLYPLPAWIFSYRDRRGCINSQPFQIRFEDGTLHDVKTGCARLRSLRTSTLQYENGFAHYRVNFDLLLRDAPIRERVTEEGWVFDMVDAGLMEIGEPDADTGLPVKLKHILDANGNEITSPVLLNGAGHPLEDPTADTPYIFYWDVYAARPFGGVLPACI